MVFLQGVGVSTSLAVRIYKTYRDARIAMVQNEPYRLASDVWGIGFKTADKIAQSLGIPHDSPERVKAGLQFTLSEASDDGPLLPAPGRADRRGGGDPGGGGGAGRAVPGRAGREEGDARALDRREADRPATGASTDRMAVYLVPFYRAEVSLAQRPAAPAARAQPSGCRPSRRSTGRRRWAGCSETDGQRRSRPSRRRPCAWP